MHPSKCVSNPEINDTFFDPDNIRLYKYKKLGDYPPEWIDITPYEESANDAANYDGWLFNDYNEIE